MNPFYSNNKKNIIIAKDANLEIKNKLKELGFNIIETIEANFLYDSIKCHPDIQIHPIDDKKILVVKNLIDQYKQKLKGYDLEIISTEECFQESFPKYLGLNIGRVSKYYIHNEALTDQKAKKILEEENIENIKVKQGYSKCSTLTIGENIIITTDRGIERELKKKKDLVVHYISPKGIKLKGMEYGFIGGCGVMINYKELLLTGNTQSMQDNKDFHQILNKYGINVIYLSNEGINDIGGFILF